MDLTKAPSKYFLLLALGAMGLIVILILWKFDPVKYGMFFPQCSFKKMTGLYCPGCGATRALYALVHGDLLRAISMNVFFVISAPLFGLMQHLDMLPKSLKPFTDAISKPIAWLVVLTAFWVLRNIPYYPFTMLAPG
jgi:hypothetical protein